MRIEINSGGMGSGLAVMEYKSSIGGVISSVDSIISSFKAVRTSTINLPGGTGSLFEAVESIDARIAKEEEKKNNAIEVRQKINSFLDLAIRVDKQVASLVNKNKGEFYRVNPWLKPATVEEKSWLQKAWDWACGAGNTVAAGFGQAVDWISDAASKAWSNIKDFYEKHKKAIATALLVIAAIAIIVLVPGGGLLATMLIGATWGVIAGAAIGGISGGMQSLANGESFWSGFENGAFSGALSGAVAGAAFAGLGFAGAAIGHSISAFSTLGKAIQVASTVTKVISIGMGAFDTLALADLIIDPSRNLLYDLNSYAHSSSVYNGIQIGAGVLAAFTGGMASTLNTTVADRTVQYTDINDVPENEYRLISEYNADSSKFNDPLRQGTTTRETEQFAKIIDSHSLSEDMVLYRRGSMNELVNYDMSNNTFEFKGFMSTTPDINLANSVSGNGNVIFEYSVPKGTTGLDLSKLMYREVIFNGGMRQIHSITRIGDITHIVCSIL